jgi:hypothetical protein
MCRNTYKYGEVILNRKADRQSSKSTFFQDTRYENYVVHTIKNSSEYSGRPNG